MASGELRMVTETKPTVEDMLQILLNKFKENREVRERRTKIRDEWLDTDHVSE
jgi:hypothetical protein